GATIAKILLGAKSLSERKLAANSASSGSSRWIAAVASAALIVTLAVVGPASAQSSSQDPSTQAAPQSSTQNPQQAPAGQSPAPAPGQAKFPPPTAQAPNRPGLREAPATNITVDGSEAMFTTMCALLAAGFEAQVSSDGWTPFRTQIRERMEHAQG